MCNLPNLCSILRETLKHKTVQLPKESTIMLDRIIEASPELAYRSHAELVMDLIRRRYEELGPVHSTK